MQKRERMPSDGETVEYIKKELERRAEMRLPFELQWRLNADFMAGNQNVDVDVISCGIDRYSPEFEWQERLSFNRIAPLMETRLANLKRVNYAMRVESRTSEPNDAEKAAVGSSLLSYLQSSEDFSAVKNTLISWAELTGSAFVMSFWTPCEDAGAGDERGGEIRLSGAMSVGESGKDIVGKDTVGKDTVGGKRVGKRADGELHLALLTPYEVYPESLECENVAEERSIIVRQVMSREEVYDLYGVESEGESICHPILSPLPSVGAGAVRDSVTYDDAVYVTTYFARPSRRCPEGRTVIVVGDEICHDGPLPHGFIPIVQIKSVAAAGSFFGNSVISSLIPLQRAYNGIRNKLLDYCKSVGVAKLLVQEGSVDDLDILRQSAPAEPVIYRAGHTPPSALNFGDLPESLIIDYRQYASDMEYIAGTSQLMVTGSTPNGVTSGTAIDNLLRIDSTRMSQTAENIRHGVLELARMWLTIYRNCAPLEKICRICGSDNIGAAITWFLSPLSDEDIVFEAENELLHPRLEQRQEFLSLLSAGIFNDENGRVPASVKRRAAELYGIADSYELSSVDILQSQAAKRENSLCRSGSAPTVGEFDDHAIHCEEHMRFYLHAEFSLLKMRFPERARAFEEHIRAHRAAADAAAAASAASADNAANNAASEAENKVGRMRRKG